MFIRHKIAAIAALMLMSGLSPIFAQPASAQDEGRQFSARSGEQVNEALTLANKGETQGAVIILQDAINAPELTAYERSTIYQMMGHYLYGLGRLAEAQQAFENSITASGLLPEENDKLKIIIAQLMIGKGQYREGAERFEAYLNAGGQQKPEYIDLLVKAWVQAEAYERALPWAEKWFQSARPKQRKHYDLLNFLYSNLGLEGRQADIVQQMINQWPEDKNLWNVWASMLANGGRESEAFEVKKIMYLKGMLTTEEEILKVVQYYSFYDMPYQAAQILEEEMEKARIAWSSKQLSVLSDLYRQAREYKRAIPILESAASLSGEAALFAKLGEALHNEGACQKSELAFSEAISRGYDVGKSWMLIASCRYDDTVDLDRLSCDMSDAQMSKAKITQARNSAIEAFERVPKTSSEYGNARTWVKFVEAEKQAVKRRCDFGEKVQVGVCYHNIKQAYDAAIFTGGFKLEDETCEAFKPAYDAKFRTQTPKSEK